MATVYSLVCFGGRLGKTVTFTDAGDVVNLTRHGLRDGTGVVFNNSGGALPTGLTAGTTYYSKQGVDNGKFTLWTDATLTTQVTFTGIGSGTNTVKGAYRNGLTPDQLLRYGDAGSERIYDGLAAWNSGRSGASNLDAEVCEIGENFIDRNTSTLYLAVPAATVRIETKVNGIRSAAFHSGIINSGYSFHAETGGIDQIYINVPNVTLDGFSITCILGWYNAYHIRVQKHLATIKNMIVIGGGGQSGPNSYGVGIKLEDAAPIAIVDRNVVIGCYRGIHTTGYAVGVRITNNLTTKNAVGLFSDSSMSGIYYNNISLGNTTNYSTNTGSGIASNNAGLAGEAWMFGAGSARLTAATSDFYGYGSVPLDLRPATSASPQVDSGSEFYGVSVFDIQGHEAPNYNNGGAEGFDVGPYEFDHGYGPHPAVHVLTLDNVVVDSRICIRDQAKTITHYNEIATTSNVEVTVPIYGDSRDNWLVDIRKASAAPFYQRYKTLMTASPGASSLYINQLPDQR